ncbi:MAG: FAD-binding oxidoreductase [Candidatus Omnitrophica bacterium]|nr:FAD-binding oxidoreductase [Candidatus Omnitrophota bacterium]
MIVKRKKPQFLSYLEDTSNIKGKAKILFIPESQKELVNLLKKASAEDMPITFSGGGTGTTGGRVPQEGAVVSLERLNRVISINPDKKEVTAQAGITLKDLEESLSKFNLTLRVSPTEPLAFLGGVVATSASGPRSFKYSSIRNYVKAIKVVLSSGEILVIERGKIFANKRNFDFQIKKKRFKFNLPSYTSPQIKSSAGYFVKDDMDLIDLFIGHEGTLGCILEATISVQNLPLDYFDCLVFFDSDKDALDFIDEIKKIKECNSFYPCAIEFFDRNSLDFVREDYSLLPSANCAVYLEQEIELPEQQDRILDYWCSLIERHNSSIDKCWFAEDYKNREKLHQFRHWLPQKINEFLRQYRQEKVATDIAVPDEKSRDMYYFYEEKARQSGVDYVIFGHIGQNHLHFNFLPKTHEESFRAKGYMLEFIEKALSFGGTVSAEHGIGKIKKPHLEIMYGKKHLEEMARLKEVFDKSCILGLDNIFSKKLLLKHR